MEDEEIPLDRVGSSGGGRGCLGHQSRSLPGGSHRCGHGGRNDGNSDRHRLRTRLSSRPMNGRGAAIVRFSVPLLNRIHDLVIAGSDGGSGFCKRRCHEHGSFHWLDDPSWWRDHLVHSGFLSASQQDQEAEGALTRVRPKAPEKGSENALATTTYQRRAAPKPLAFLIYGSPRRPLAPRDDSSYRVALFNFKNFQPLCARIVLCACLPVGKFAQRVEYF